MATKLKDYTDDLTRGYVVRWVHRYEAKSDGAMIARSAWWYGPRNYWNAWGPLDFSVAVFPSRTTAELAMRKAGLNHTGVSVQTVSEARATDARDQVARAERAAIVRAQ